MGSNGWEAGGKGEEMWRRDVASHPGFILIPAVSLLQGPGGPALRGRDEGATAEGGREGGRRECGGRE